MVYDINAILGENVINNLSINGYRKLKNYSEEDKKGFLQNLVTKIYSKIIEKSNDCDFSAVDASKGDLMKFKDIKIIESESTR